MITVMYISVFSWRRQTRLRQVGASGGLRGDVYYFAPCGKKLRTYPEVTRVSKKLCFFKMVLFSNSFMYWYLIQVLKTVSRGAYHLQCT